MISVLVAQPPHIDYPYFRSRLSDLSAVKGISEIIIGVTGQAEKLDLSDWFKKNLEGCVVFAYPKWGDPDWDMCKGDWRSKVTNRMIDVAEGSWLLFMEQDFLIKDYTKFFKVLMEAMKKNDVIGFKDHPDKKEERLHPAFLLVRSWYVNETSRDFSAAKEKDDHFWEVTTQLKSLTKKITLLPELGLEPGKDWLHVGSLTYELCNPQNYDAINAKIYNDKSFKLKVPIDGRWVGRMLQIKSYTDKYVKDREVPISEFLI